MKMVIILIKISKCVFIYLFIYLMLFSVSCQIQSSSYGLYIKDCDSSCCSDRLITARDSVCR